MHDFGICLVSIIVCIFSKYFLHSLTLRVTILANIYKQAERGASMKDKATDYEKLKSLRKEKGLTQADLSKSSNVPLGTIKSIETGRYPLSQEYAGKIADVLMVTADDLYLNVARNTCVIPLVLQKGGVGKTAISVNLAYALSLKYRVLLIDTDPQRSSSNILGFSGSSHPPKNFYDAYIVDEDLAAHIENTPYPNLDIIPGSFSMDNIDVSIAAIPMREHRMKEQVDKLKEAALYDYIIIDTNPNFGVFNTSILYASDEVLIPVEPDTQSLDMLEKLLLRLEMVQKYNPSVNLLGIVYNLRESNRNLSKSTIKTLRKMYGDAVLETEIDRLAAVPDAIEQRIPVGVYKPNSRSAVQYRELAKEVHKLAKSRKAK